MAAEDDFDDSDVAPSAAEANEELRRLAATRAHEYFEQAEQRAIALKARLEEIGREVANVSARIVLMANGLDNWIGLLRELKEKESAE